MKTCTYSDNISYQQCKQHGLKYRTTLINSDGSIDVNTTASNDCGVDDDNDIDDDDDYDDDDNDDDDVVVVVVVVVVAVVVDVVVVVVVVVIVIVVLIVIVVVVDDDHLDDDHVRDRHYNADKILITCAKINKQDVIVASNIVMEVNELACLLMSIISDCQACGVRLPGLLKQLNIHY